ncbi:hypothetical protein J6590_049116 [Homalodisca vitripennis]|nr:hypothetical protein J6590_049116 [Homalodisca vitripennis]
MGKLIRSTSINNIKKANWEYCTDNVQTRINGISNTPSIQILELYDIRTRLLNRIQSKGLAKRWRHATPRLSSNGMIIYIKSNGDGYTSRRCKDAALKKAWLFGSGTSDVPPVTRVQRSIEELIITNHGASSHIRLGSGGRVGKRTYSINDVM